MQLIVTNGKKQLKDNNFRIPANKEQKFLFEECVETDKIIIKNKQIKYIPNTGWIELTVGVLEKDGEYHSLNPSITVVEGEVLSLEEKFQGGTGINITPPDKTIIPNADNAIKLIKEKIELSSKLMGIKNYARVDIFFNILTNELIIIEPNSLPGLTASTVFFQQAIKEIPSIMPLQIIETIIQNKIEDNSGLNMAFTAKGIVRICGGKLLSGAENIKINNFSKDTRTIKYDDMYAAIKGDNFNGNQFAEKAMRKGAVGAIVDEDIAQNVLDKYEDRVIIKVENTIKALQDLAKYKRDKYNIPVIAVTGSVGKTSTKDMIASVLSAKYDVLKTEGNLNNEIGLPLTLLKLNNHTAVVVEMGMNHFGEIHKLTNIAKPTIAVITNIGTSHIGNLGSRENILKAKLEILDGLSKQGKVFVNNDNDLLHKFYIENKEYNIITCGINEESDFFGYDINLNEKSSNYAVNINNTRRNISVPIGGKHYIYNSLIAVAIGNTLRVDIKDIIQRIEKCELTKMRMNVQTVKNNILLINDTYNASYESMKYAIEYLGNIENRNKIAVLGDMGELGEFSIGLHRKVGEEVFKNGIDILITVGRDAKYIAERLKELKNNQNNIYQCENADDAIHILNNILQEDDAVLVKGSRMMKLERIIDRSFIY